MFPSQTWSILEGVLPTSSGCLWSEWWRLNSKLTSAAPLGNDAFWRSFMIQVCNWAVKALSASVWKPHRILIFSSEWRHSICVFFLPQALWLPCQRGYRIVCKAPSPSDLLRDLTEFLINTVYDYATVGLDGVSRIRSSAKHFIGLDLITMW